MDEKASVMFVLGVASICSMCNKLFNVPGRVSTRPNDGKMYVM